MMVAGPLIASPSTAEKASMAARGWLEALLIQDWKQLAARTVVPYYPESRKTLKSAAAVVEMFRKAARKKGKAWEKLEIVRVVVPKDDRLFKRYRKKYDIPHDTIVVGIILREKNTKDTRGILVFVSPRREYKILGMKD